MDRPDLLIGAAAGLLVTFWLTPVRRLIPAPRAAQAVGGLALGFCLATALIPGGGHG